MSKRNTPPTTPKRVQVAQETHQLYQGPIPPPDVLQRFDDLAPGTAQRLIDLAVAESQHRRDMETRALHANIADQQQQRALARYEAQATVKSARIGQLIGVLLALACVSGAIYLAESSPWIAAVLIGIPMASVIRAFVARH